MASRRYVRDIGSGLVYLRPGIVVIHGNDSPSSGIKAVDMVAGNMGVYLDVGVGTLVLNIGMVNGTFCEVNGTVGYMAIV